MPNGFTTFVRCFSICCLGLIPSANRSFCAEEGLHAGPLFDRFSLTLDSGERTEAIGPLFYQQQKDSERILAVPPLFSDTQNADVEAKEFDFLYPLLTYDRYGAEYRWQLFQLLSLSGGQNQQGVSKSRFTIFPLYFQQRSPDPAQNYTALMPFYGTLKKRLFRDEIHFIMFPFYIETRRGDVVTDNYLYPFFHVRRGEGLNGWQFWPLTGHEHKEVTTRTNQWGDVETVPGHDNRFILWPFFSDQIQNTGTDNPEHQQALLPFYSYLRSPQRDSTSYLWPLGLTITDDRAKKYHEVDAPWPLIVFAHGEGKTTARVLPLFSRAHNASVESDSYLWPVYRYSRVHSGALDRRYTRILFFLCSDLAEKNAETGAERTRTDFWPLFTRRCDFNGNSRLQILAPLEPILPNNKSIERNYSPLWSLWRSEKNPKTGAASQSLLWNLYRRDSTPTAQKCSLLFGLFQYQSDAQAKSVRLFFIPFNRTKHNEG
jgi:hypothetical protein